MEEEVRHNLREMDAKLPRKLVVRMGDKVQGKYWPLVTKERLKDPSSVYIADKNVPASTWELVAKVAATTKALAVPVIPDSMALQTTVVTGVRKPNGELQQEDRKHSYPFSFSYLAVSLVRVLDRPSGSHTGKLDSGTSRACMIVIKFFTFYRRLTADEYRDTIRSKCAQAGAISASVPIEVPFFSNDASLELPEDLKTLLVEALQASVRSFRVFV